MKNGNENDEKCEKEEENYFILRKHFFLCFKLSFSNN
jgi:hypothetical protein